MRKFLVGIFIFLGVVNNVFGQISISSKYIEVVMDNSSGRFFVRTLIGDPDNPKDDKKRILFDGMPPTTYPSLFVDGEGFAVGTDDGYFDGRPSISKNRLVWTWRPKKFDRVKMIQTIEIVTNPFTMRDDMVRISYIVVNEGNLERTVNVRLLLDTVLGEGDNAPFYVPPYGKIDKETVFYEGNMPNVWYSFDSLKEPKVRSMGILSGIEGVTTPTMLIFANWRKIDREKWFYNPEVGAGFSVGLFGGRDTAVGIYFKPVKLKPQEITLYSTMFGLYGDTLKSFDNFSVSLNVPEVVKSFPFNVSAVVENTSVDIRNLKVSLEFNTNYFYTTNTSYFITTNLKVGDSSAYSWEIFGNQNVVDGEYEVKVLVYGEAFGTNVSGEVIKTFRVQIGKEEKKVDLSELGVKQTNINTNFIQTNILFLTNIYTNYTEITNVVNITNLYEYICEDDLSRIRSMIDYLNKQLDNLITTYYLSKDPEEKERIRRKIEVIRSQIEVEEEKIKILIDR